MKRPSWAALDRLIFYGGVMLLVVVFVAFSRANIAADSVDYYGMLQWLTPEPEKPILRNLYFAQQRSPGYSLSATIPYFLLTFAVDPFVTTEQVVEYPPPPPFFRGPPPPRWPPEETFSNPAKEGFSTVHGPGFPPPGPKGSEFALIPPRPLLLRHVPFKDFYVPHEGSWFQWKLVLALATTSLFFLVVGVITCGQSLRCRFSDWPAYALVIVAILCSPIFLVNIVTAPLYATFTAFGVSSLFLLSFIRAHETGTPTQALLCGAFLGYLVLVRLEVAVFAGTLAFLLIVKGQWRLAVLLVIGASWALVAWVLYNFAAFGKWLNFAILKGDINRLTFRPGYFFDSLLHPLSGVVFWTPVLLPGLIGLFLSRSSALRFLGVASVVLVILYALRVPIMYDHVGGPPLEIGGIPVTPPPTSGAMRELIRADNNRYVTVLLPFLIVGVRELLAVVAWAERPAEKPVTAP
ncbi:MAG: hypothetical protein NZ899_10410 [Thermoguttaceae bacterium]|nr:hypothetical protein [Thermoguttaceae bacterium]